MPNPGQGCLTLAQAQDPFAQRASDLHTQLVCGRLARRPVGEQPRSTEMLRVEGLLAVIGCPCQSSEGSCPLGNKRAGTNPKFAAVTTHRQVRSTVTHCIFVLLLIILRSGPRMTAWFRRE